MVRFRQQSDAEQARTRPRNYFARREQYRLLFLVFLLMAIGMMMVQAAKPSTWAWMWNGSKGATTKQVDEPIDTRLAKPTNRSEVAHSFVATPVVSNEADSNDEDADSRFPQVTTSQASVIRDDTVFRAPESEVWFDIVRQLNQATEAQLAPEAADEVGFVQLFRQPDAYRGRLVQVSGIVRRVNYVKATKNIDEVDGYWRCWLFTSDSTQNPIVVYVLDMPEEFPNGMKVFEHASFTGVFFKRWAYQAKGGIMSAPLVVARSADWTPQPKLTDPEPLNWGLILPISILTGLLICWFVYQQSRSIGRTKRRGERLPDTLPTDVLPKVLLLGASIVFLMASSVRAQDEPETPKPIAKEPREMLRVFGVDSADFDSLEDGQAFHTKELPLLLRILNRTPEFPLDRVESWTLGAPALAKVASDPSTYRGSALRMQFQVHRIASELIGPPWNDRLPFRRYYVVHGKTTDTESEQGRGIVVYTREIPKTWKSLLDEPELSPPLSASVVGLFLKNEESASAFSAHRIAWHPQRAAPKLKVTESHVALGALGFDVGLLDTVTDKTSLKASERECFYALLATAGINTTSTTQAKNVANIAYLLQSPKEHRGNRYQLKGTARRAIKIQVSDADIIKRFGIDHYYEMEFFVQSDRKIRFSDDGRDREFWRFPVALCTREMPAGMQLGENIRVPIEADGYFLKYWGYKASPSPNAKDQGMNDFPLQFCPLLIGGSPRVIEPTARQSTMWDWALGFVFLAIIGAITAYVVNAERRNRRARRQRFADRPSPPMDHPPLG